MGGCGKHNIATYMNTLIPPAGGIKKIF
jgi:hypothetical protein